MQSVPGPAKPSRIEELLFLQEELEADPPFPGTGPRFHVRKMRIQLLHPPNPH